MKKAAIILCIFAAITLFLLTSCGNTPIYTDEKGITRNILYEKFVVLESTNSYNVCYHKDTKVMYYLLNRTSTNGPALAPVFVYDDDLGEYYLARYPQDYEEK